MFKRVAVVESERVGQTGTGTIVDCGLTVILASVFHTCHFPQPVRGAVEARAAQHLEQLRVMHVDFAALHDPLVEKTCSTVRTANMTQKTRGCPGVTRTRTRTSVACKPFEVVPVKRAAEALAVRNRVRAASLFCEQRSIKEM